MTSRKVILFCLIGTASSLKLRLIQSEGVSRRLRNDRYGCRAIRDGSSSRLYYSPAGIDYRPERRIDREPGTQSVSNGIVIGGSTYTVPNALGDKIIHPYGDFLLHDVGTGDGIVQAGPQDTANKLRTVPLWGVHIKSRFTHDNASLTLLNAIQRHAGEATQVTSRFNGLTAQEQQQLMTFLRSL
jgi:hypothetical protein